MASNLIKILAISGGCAGVIGGGTAIYLTRDKEVKDETPKDLVNTEQEDPEGKTIISWLEEEGISILVDGDTAWKDNWKNFKKPYTDTKLPEEDWKLENWAQVFNQEEAPESFKKKCQSNATKKIKTKENNNLYKDLKKYCTKQSS